MTLIAGRHLNVIACAGLLALTFVLTGCGDSPPVRKGAAKELEHAQNLLSAGDDAYRSRNYETAIADYKNAKDAVEEGRPNATESEESLLKTLASSCRQKISDAEMKQITDKPEVKTVVATQIQKEDEADKKKMEKEKADAEIAAKKEEEKAKALAKAMSQNDSGSRKKEDEGAAPPAGDKSVAGGDKPKAPAGDGTDQGGEAQDAKVDPGMIEPAKPPFPAVTDKSPEVNIVKLATRGRFVWAFVQVYNKDDNGHRINVVNAFFKDKDRQTMIDHGVAAFPFAGFRENAKDMIGDQGSEALTLGSDSIDGHGFKRYVVIGEHERAKDCKIATVQMVYNEGGRPYAEGPSK